MMSVQLTGAKRGYEEMAVDAGGYTSLGNPIYANPERPITYAIEQNMDIDDYGGVVSHGASALENQELYPTFMRRAPGFRPF